MVPVSTRHTDERGTLGNRVSAIFADLPVGIEDPVERLHAVSAQLGSLKTSGTALGMDALLGAADLLPAGLFALGVRTWGRLPQRSISTVVTNVPGPQQPLYLLGSRLRSSYRYIPPAIELRTTVGDVLCRSPGWAFTGDAASVPDVAELATGTEQAVADLLATLPDPRRSGSGARPTGRTTSHPIGKLLPGMPPTTSLLGGFLPPGGWGKGLNFPIG